MNAIPLINNAPKFRPDVNVNVNHIGGQSFNPVSPQMGNVMRQNPASMPINNETQLRQEVNTSIVALKREAFSLENLIAQAAQTLQDVNNRLSELEGKQGDYVKKADATVAGVGGDGKYISAISETDGKINATATDLGNMVPVNSVTSGNMHSVTSGAVKDYTDTLIKIYQKNIGTYTIGAGQTISPNINSYTKPAPNGYSRLSFLYAKDQNFFHCDVNFANGVAYATITNNYTSSLTSKFVLYHIYIPWSGVIT